MNRVGAPVRRDERLGRWVVTRYDEAVAVLRDPVAYSSRVIPRIPGRPPELDDFAEWSARWLFFLDPPEHGPLRAPVARALAPRAVADRAGAIRAAADRLLARLPAEFDLLSAYAHPLAAGLIADLLCAPGAETDDFLARCRAMEAAGVDARDPEARRQGLAAMAGATAWMKDRLAAGGPLPRFPAELRAAGSADVGPHSLLLLFAGVETTQNLIANAVHALLTHPAQLAALRDDPELVPSAVEEAARYALPVLGVLRRATRDAVIGGVSVPEGDELVVMVGTANRDPARFTDPDAFDVRRHPNPHLAYGVGSHYCPGAALTRLTVGIALRALLDRFPRLELAEDELVWRDHDPIIRGLKRLPVRGGR